MLDLTNNFSLLLKVVNNNSPARKITVPKGSSLRYERQTTHYHTYYETHSYLLYCLFEGIRVLIHCSKLTEGKEPKVDCIKGNLHKTKK
mgnify:CR=1 FL=1